MSTVLEDALGIRRLVKENHELRAALRDLRLGAVMMMEPPLSPGVRRYAEEVKRVADAALRGDA